MQPASVPLAYQGIERVAVLCLLQRDGAVADPAETARLCSMIARVAGEGTDLPTETIQLGDPAVMAHDRLTVLVHGALQGDGSVALTMRPYRPSVAGSDVLFGAMPRVARFADDAALLGAVAASLDEILPWRRPATGARPMN